MKKNTHNIDNRAEWKMKRIMHENVISDSQFHNLAEYKTNSAGSNSVKNFHSLRSVIHSFRYMFN